jgi:hypothetical protein
MVEVCNESGSVIPGFERNKCVIWDGTTSPLRDTQVDVTRMKLSWSGSSARQLAGQTIRLRFYLGGSTVYAVTTDPMPTSVKNPKNEISGVGIYPNPTTDRVYFKNLPENCTVTVVDLMGRKLLEEKTSEIHGGLSLSSFEKGLYILSVSQGLKIVHNVKVFKWL